CALRPEFGLVAVRHAHDHLMDARGHGGADDRTRIRSLLEPRNVVLNRPVQERYFLRQKTDVRAELDVTPLAEIGIVQPNAAAQRRPDSDLSQWRDIKL